MTSSVFFFIPFSPHAACLKKSHHVLSVAVFADFREDGAVIRLFESVTQNLEIIIKVKVCLEESAQAESKCGTSRNRIIDYPLRGIKDPRGQWGLGFGRGINGWVREKEQHG